MSQTTSHEIRTRFLFEARVRIDPTPIAIGPTPEGERAIYRVLGGTFDGPAMRGRVVPDSGADWVRVRADGAFHLDVRFCLETDDGAMLYLHWNGRFHAPAEHLEYAMDQAKPDDPAGADRYYFRTAPQFETADDRYAWLNNVIAVSMSRTGDGGVIHRVHEVL